VEVKFTKVSTKEAPEHEAATPLTELCQACGLCCNGVLFADVKLRPADRSDRLSALGAALAKNGNRLVLPQPCSCFDGKLCRIYADRPSLCRAFECHVLKRAVAGALSQAGARSIVSQTLREARTVRALLLRLGDTNEDLPLTLRYARMMEQPISLADPSSSRRRATLMRAMDKLARRLAKEFLAE
jgi:uncharacterized protein